MAARWMAERGFPELSEPIASHPIPCLLDPSRAPHGWASVAVAVADRRVAQEFVSVDERIDDLERRYPAARAELEAARAPAHAMEAELATAAGLSNAELDARLSAAWKAARR
jgi:hypothetical protein